MNTDAARFAALRASYPAASRMTWLNGGSRGLISRTAHAAAVAALDADLAMADADPPNGRQLIEARENFAALIGARPTEIAVTKNVSEGLNVVATAIDWKPGDNIVTCSDVEHANNVYLWHRLTRLGVSVRDVPSRDGVIDPADMSAAMDGRTRLVTASSVSFVPGYRTDLAAIAQAAHVHGALFLVDGVQSCGVLALDVEALGIDALATSTSKGLLGVRGLGFLYVRESRLPELSPVHVARNSMQITGHYSEFEGADATLRPDARRFECGNYNYVGIAVARVALDETLAIGIDRIEAHAVGLATRLAEGLAEQGWPVSHPPQGVARSHLVTLGQRGAGGADATGNPALDALSQRLNAAGVRHAIRRRMLRFGFHLYNNADDVTRVLDIARACNPRLAA